MIHQDQVKISPLIRPLHHWLVVPLFGEFDRYDYEDMIRRFDCLMEAGYSLVLVDNNPSPCQTWPDRYCVIDNQNSGGVAGGFNCGIHFALSRGAQWITLLDQDSDITEDALSSLREPFHAHPHARLLVGPMIWDERRSQLHQPPQQQWHEFLRTRLLISSGTTFAAKHWSALGPLNEELFIDYVDHTWSFLAQASGFVLLQHPRAVMRQRFGQRHPQLICRLIGMELYSPLRHFYSLRNVRWLALQPWVPLDIRIKESIKMLIKPMLWILFEPRRRDNLTAIVSALRSPLPESIRCVS